MNKRRNVAGWGLLLCFFIAACNSDTGTHHSEKRSSHPAKTAHQIQKTKKKSVDINKPVAVFMQNMDDQVTNNDFIVKIYPTLKTDKFKMVIQYGGNTANDEVDMIPKKYYKTIALRKGATNQQCVMGFIDHDDKFNKMTLITASATSISLKKLKAYYLTTK